jgi:benzoyl-CoA reductase/2-hydroxyglutaryl-CoA dehydratase subunit BcrC/BadD/HgdB
LRLARSYRADGVVHFSHRGCKALTGGFPFVARALRAAGIPVLELSGDCVDDRSAAAAPWRSRLEAFAEMLG